MATISKPSKIFITALWSQSMAQCQVSTFFDFFCIFKFFDNEKVNFGCGCTQLFGVLPCSFFLNKASTCGEDYKRDFSNHVSLIIYVPIVQNGITCIKRKENVVNHLNMENEPRRCQTCRVMISWSMLSIKKNHLQTTKIRELSLKI